MITSVRLQNFRSYQDESFEFDRGVNIIVGPNASGKTNLLEAILVLALGGSHRARDIELVRLAAAWSRVDGFFAKQPRSLKLEHRNGALSKSFLINERPYKRLGLELMLPIVFFDPNHLQLITSGPEQRRHYIDELLERSQPGFKTLSASYQRALSQRNALLKHGMRAAKQQLFAWNIRLSELAAKIAQARAALIGAVNQDLAQSYSRIAHHRSSVELKYNNQFPVDRYASRLLSKLEQTHERDIRVGFTSSGPHREDIIFYLNGQLLNQTASRGETRSVMLALKMFELQLLEAVRGQKPILLLDDVFSELDSARRRALVNHLVDYQSLITTTDADAVVQHFTKDHHLIALEKKNKLRDLT